MFENYSPMHLRNAIEFELKKCNNPKLAAITAIKNLENDPTYYGVEMQKARITKYIRREADGKGGWKYFYKEDSKSQVKKEQTKTTQTETPEFKKWFGDSKVVDESGKPLIVYHGRSIYTRTEKIIKVGEREYNEYKKIKEEIWDRYKRKTEDIFAIPWESRYNNKKLNNIVENAVKERDKAIEKLGPEPTEIRHIPIKNKNINKFDRRTLGANTIGNASSPEFAATSLVGFWSSSKDIAQGKNSTYDESMSLYYKIVNPKIYDNNQDLADDISRYLDDNTENNVSVLKKNTNEFVKDLRNDGYDGIIIERDIEFGGTSYVAFSPTQIKSATGNRGTFDPENADMTKAVSQIKMKKIVDEINKKVTHDYHHKYSDMIKSMNHKYIFRKSDGKGGWKYTYTDDFRNGKKIASDKEIKLRMKFDSHDLIFNFNSIGYSERVGSIKTSEKSLSKSKEIENNILSFWKEYTSIIDASGRVILSKIGGYDEVQFDKDEIKKIRNSEILTHTHPEDKSFSVEDVFLGLSLGIKELRVKTPGNIYYFKISHNQKSSDKNDLSNKNRYFMDVIVNLNEKITGILRKKVRDGKSNQKEAEKEHRELLWEAVAKSPLLADGFNIEYGKIKK
jgi:hypothetical protein